MIKAAAKPGQVSVFTPTNREMLPEEWGALATARIMSVSDSAPPVIKDQAVAFRDQIEFIITHYMREAIRSDRYHLAKNLAMSGQPDLAAMVTEQ